MGQNLHMTSGETRESQYEDLSRQWPALFMGETNRTANLANAAAVLMSAFGWHWVGFYLVDFESDELVLGPFQGPLACTRLFHGKGVCAAAWDTKLAQVVADVEAFPGHVVCSSKTKSELVLPILVDDDVVAVLDIDSDERNDFTKMDAAGLRPLVDCLSENWIEWK
jgi:GAF domain-containing protein